MSRADHVKSQPGYSNKMRRRRVARGMCANCGVRPPREGMSQCQECKDAQRERMTKQRALDKEVVLAWYGGRCACCGENNLKFLTMDHVDGGGHQHRKTGIGYIYSYLISQFMPSGFQILCYNCNCGRAMNGGVCPHKEIHT